MKTEKEKMLADEVYNCADIEQLIDGIQQSDYKKNIMTHYRKTKNDFLTYWMN